MLRLLFLVLMSCARVVWADSEVMDMNGMHADRPMAAGDVKAMKMSMPAPPAQFEATNRAFTANHRFLVKVVAMPDAIPLAKHFSLDLAVFDGKHVERKLQDAAVHVTAGMRHGMKTGFAHGMQYAPKVEVKDGIVTISGLSFHMTGKWTLQVDVQKGADKGTAYIDLPCCASGG